MLMLYILAVIVLIILILGMAAPKSSTVSRKIVVNKTPEEVYNSIKSLKEQQKWSPWSKRDPNMKTEFKGNDGEVGSVHHWIGNKDVGEGEQEIIKLTPNTKVETELRFLKPFKATNKAWFNINEVEAGTEVEWGFYSKNKFPMSIMMMFMSVEKFIGKDYEEGLAAFKEVIESDIIKK